MPLTVEDGTGLANADAFISVADADDYHAARGNVAWTGPDADKEAAIRRASFFLSSAYTWKGYRLKGRAQSLAWPRYDVFDQENWSVPSNAVPPEIQQATAEVALRELVAPGSMTPDVVIADKVKREKVGEIEVEYLNSATGADASVPVLTVVRGLIDGLLASAGSAYFGQAVRA